jgi:hypothetical protein
LMIACKHFQKKKMKLNKRVIVALYRSPGYCCPGVETISTKMVFTSVLSLLYELNTKDSKLRLNPTQTRGPWWPFIAHLVTVVQVLRQSVPKWHTHLASGFSKFPIHV